MTNPTDSTSTAPSLFVHYLEQECDAAELERFYRIVQGCLFVDERAEQKTIALYQGWQKQVTDASTEKSIEKVRRRMFGSELEEVAYVLDGKRCLTGRCARGVEVDAASSKIKVAHAGVLSAKDYIHPRDPMLASLTGAKAELDRHKGLIFVLETGYSRLEVSVRTVQSLVELMRASSALRKRFPEVNGLLRDSVESVLAVIARAKVVKKSEKLLVPSDVASIPDVTVTRSGFLYFAISDSKIVSCFNLHPKSMAFFLREQITSLKAASKLPRGVETALKNRKHVCSTKIQGKSFALSIAFFSSFLVEMQKSKKQYEKLPRYFSLLHLLNRMVPLLKSAKPVSELEVLQTLGRRPRREAIYKSSGPWIFVIEEKSVCTAAILLSGKEEQKSSRSSGPRRRRRPRRRSARSGEKNRTSSAPS